MFNLYQSMGKKSEEETGARRRASDVTGHDRFYQERSKSRRRRRSVGRRTKSAVEFDTNAILAAQERHARRHRSASIESTASTSSDDRVHFTVKLDNLTRVLFNRVSTARAYREKNTSFRTSWYSNEPSVTGNPTTAPVIRFCCGSRRRSRENSIQLLDQRYPRVNYESLDSIIASFEDKTSNYPESERKARIYALTICKIYIEESLRYRLIRQLCNLGSRVNKHWFAVHDTVLKTERLLTLVPLNHTCPLTPGMPTKDLLNRLFLALQHPYICPVLDLEFIDHNGLSHLIIIQPINHGSLKDLIFGIPRNCWNEDWSHKYPCRGDGLTVSQILQMGRQILEALIFLKERGFPTVNHLHSGNVVIQNGVARLSGLENSLLGFTSRNHPIVTSRIITEDTIDTICFGHMLFEMCTGYELSSFKPTHANLADLENFPKVVDLMETIFDNPEGHYPTVEELLVHDLFRNIDLREMRNGPINMLRPNLSPSIMTMLDTVKRYNSNRRFPSIVEEASTPQSPQPGTSYKNIADVFVEEITQELESTAL